MAALDVDSQDLYIRIVDVGAGLCAIVRAPGDHFLVYDSGHWQGQHCIKAVRELVQTDSIDFMFLSTRGRAVLFTGDTVGRRLADPDDACKDAEKVMVERHAAGTVSLKSDVLVASHHGGNNGSAACFIEAINPGFVVFSSGHDHQHPTSAAAHRSLTHGITASQLFRTDFGDDEVGAFEWKLNSVAGCQDPAGDDDVEIALKGDGSVEVDYLRTPAGCDSRTGN